MKKLNDGKNSLETLLAKSFSEDSEIWQIRLVSDRDLCNLARDRGLSFWCLGDEIKQLWQIGLLKADLVLSDSQLEIENLNFLQQDEY